MMTVNMIMIAAAMVCAVVGILLLRTPSPKKDRDEEKKASGKEDVVKVRNAGPPEPQESDPQDMVVPLTPEEVEVEKQLKEKPKEKRDKENHQESGATPQTPRDAGGDGGAGGEESRPDEDDEPGGMPLMMFDE